MEFYIPTRIYHEDGAVLNHGSEIASLGRKALIVTGRSSAVKTGALDDVITAEDLPVTIRAFQVFCC